MKIKILVLLALILSPLFLIQTTHAADCPQNGGYNEAVCNPASNFFIDLTTKGKTNTFGDLILFIIERALQVVGVLALAFVIYGGYQYITSAGDEEAAAAGKKTLTNAIIGLVIIIVSYTVIIVIINALK